MSGDRYAGRESTIPNMKPAWSDRDALFRIASLARAAEGDSGDGTAPKPR